jgi:hypothetical protein
MLKDSKENIWIGSWGGVCKVEENNITCYTTNEGSLEINPLGLIRWMRGQFPARGIHIFLITSLKRLKIKWRGSTYKGRSCGINDFHHCLTK